MRSTRLPNKEEEIDDRSHFGTNGIMQKKLRTIKLNIIIL